MKNILAYRYRLLASFLYAWLTPAFAANVTNSTDLPVYEKPYIGTGALPSPYLTHPKTDLANDGFLKDTSPPAFIPDKHTTARITAYKAAPRDDSGNKIPVSPFDNSGFGIAYQPQSVPNTQWSLGRPVTDTADNPAAENNLRLDRTLTDDIQAGVEFHIPY